jgi:hypothetical protein
MGMLAPPRMSYLSTAVELIEALMYIKRIVLERSRVKLLVIRQSSRLEACHEDCDNVGIERGSVRRINVGELSWPLLS